MDITQYNALSDDEKAALHEGVARPVLIKGASAPFPLGARGSSGRRSAASEGGIRCKTAGAAAAILAVRVAPDDVPPNSRGAIQ